MNNRNNNNGYNRSNRFNSNNSYNDNNNRRPARGGRGGFMSSPAIGLDERDKPDRRGRWGKPRNSESEYEDEFADDEVDSEDDFDDDDDDDDGEWKSFDQAKQQQKKKKQQQSKHAGIKPAASFSELGIEPRFVQQLESSGITKPTAIQVCVGSDLIQQINTLTNTHTHNARRLQRSPKFCLAPTCS